MPLPIRKNIKEIGLMKYELIGRIIKEFLPLKPKMYNDITDDDFVDKKAKDKKSARQRLRNEYNVSINKVEKITLSTKDGKRLQMLNGTKSYPYVISLHNI